MATKQKKKIINRLVKTSVGRRVVIILKEKKKERLQQIKLHVHVCLEASYDPSRLPLETKTIFTSISTSPSASLPHKPQQLHPIDAGALAGAALFLFT